MAFWSRMMNVKKCHAWDTGCFPSKNPTVQALSTQIFHVDTENEKAFKWMFSWLVVTGTWILLNSDEFHQLGMSSSPSDWWFGTFFTFSIYWECHHPRADDLIFFRGVGLNHQPAIFPRGRWLNHQAVRRASGLHRTPSVDFSPRMKSLLLGIARSKQWI